MEFAFRQVVVMLQPTNISVPISEDNCCYLSKYLASLKFVENSVTWRKSCYTYENYELFYGGVCSASGDPLSGASLGGGFLLAICRS